MYYSLITWRSCWSCLTNNILWNEENGQLSFFSEHLLNFFFLSKDPFQVGLKLLFSACWNLLNTLIPYFSAFQEPTWAALPFARFLTKVCEGSLKCRKMPLVLSQIMFAYFNMRFFHLWTCNLILKQNNFPEQNFMLYYFSANVLLHFNSFLFSLQVYSPSIEIFLISVSLNSNWILQCAA